MKKISLIIPLICLALAVCAQKVNYKLNLQTSLMKWDAKKVIGGHVGTINLKEGTIRTDNGKIIDGEFIIDMNSMVCTDAPKLTAHLKNEDFFNVPSFPTGRFVISKVDYSGTSPVVTGNLTIKNKTKTISFPAKISNTENGLTADAMGIKINRLDFDIQYRSSSLFSGLGDKAIDDVFSMDIRINAIK